MRVLRGAVHRDGGWGRQPEDRPGRGLTVPERLEDRRPHRGRRGLTLLEITITLAVLVTVLLGFSQALVHSMAASRVNRERALATDAARQVVEQLQGTNFREVFAENNSVAGDETDGVPTRLAGFEVPGLDPQQGDADGLCGRILFPEVVAGGSAQLRENLQDFALEMPKDLNGDTLVDGADHSTDYQILPVIVRVEWRGSGGPARVEFKTILSDF